MPLFTRCNISPRCSQNVSVKFQLKIPHRSLLYNFENAYFEWKQKHAVSVHVSLNANELLLPAPFSRIVLIPQIPCQKHLFGFDYHACHAEIMHFKPY